MPILQIQLIGDSSAYPADLAQQLADSAGAALQSRPQGTWVTLLFVPPNHYAENGGAGAATQPIIASLIESSLPAGSALQDRLQTLTQAIATTTGHPAEQVHIIVEPPARGRVTFGGELVN